MDKTIKNKSCWKCVENCGARVIIINRNTVYTEKFATHNHSPLVRVK